jgi:hapalindole H/12-epi-hapalindole U/12-epi-fischerindole U/hapalindole U synthase
MKRNLLATFGSRSLLTALFIICGLINNPAFATAISIVNAGFEETILADDTWIPNAPSGWMPYTAADLTLGAGFGPANPPTGMYPSEAPEGQNVVYLYGDGSGEFGIYQILAAVLTPNTTYTLKVEVGNPAAYDIWDFAGFPGYRIGLVAGGTILSSDENSLSPLEGTFETSTLTFTAPSNHSNIGDSLEIWLINPQLGPGLEIDFDNVRLDATSENPVPVPGTLALFALGLAGLGLSRRWDV